MPISVFTGMAGTVRLQNLIIQLEKYQNININNVIIYRGNLDDNHDKEFFCKVNQYKLKYALYNPFTLFLVYINAFKIIKSIYKKSDKNIIYNYGYPHILNVPILIFAKTLGFKVIFDIVEDNSTIVKYKSLISAFKIRSSIFLLNHLAWIADGAIGISYHIYEKLKLVSKNKFPVVHIPISINSELFTHDPKPISNHKDIVVFYGGSFGNKDGLEYLLEAFDQVAGNHPNIELRLSGKGLKRDMDSFYKIMNRKKNKEKIRYLGFISYNEYIMQLKNADILCMTRNSSSFANAGFPFKLGEMLATGNPVIVTNVGDIRKFVSCEEACLIRPDSVDDIKIYLEKIISDYQKFKLVGEKGKSVALKNFSSDKTSEVFVELLYLI